MQHVKDVILHEIHIRIYFEKHLERLSRKKEELGKTIEDPLGRVWHHIIEFPPSQICGYELF